MRKLIIDADIRGFAIKYRKAVEKACPDVTEDLENLKTFVVANNTWGNASAVEEYFNAIIGDYPSLLNQEPKNWDLKKYKDIEKKEPGMLSKVVLYHIDSKGKQLRSELYKRIVFCMRYSDIRAILGGIHQEMGLKTCIYCNAKDTLTGSGDDVFYEMDHFMPKSKHPFLCTCFYNLQPSCSDCNKHKKTQDSDFGLYVNVEEGKEINPYLFVPQVTDIKGMGDHTCISIGFTGKDKVVTPESKEHNRIFHMTCMWKPFYIS